MHFEDELGKALRHTADTFTAEWRPLAERSLARGRRRLARRRASVVAGGALAVALVATAGVRLDGAPDDGDVRGGQAATPDAGYRHFEVTAEQMENILRNGMDRAGIPVMRPKVEGTGSSDRARAATAAIDFDDSGGGATVTLSVRRVDPSERDLKKLITCPPEEDSPYEECTTQPDNRAVKGYTGAGEAGGVKEWAVTMLSPNGYLIEVATHNLPRAEFVVGRTEVADVTRNPRMNPGKLRHLAMFVDGSFSGDGRPNSFGTVEPGSRAEPGDILPVLKALLPKRLHVHSEGAASGAEGHVVVVDPETGDRTYIEAVRTVPDGRSLTETLADGTKVGAQRLPGEQPGVVQLRVEALRVNGLAMSLSAYNAPSPASEKSGAAPLITAEELKGIATSRTWLLAR
ncbi:hypothetical protein ACH4F6_28635 [Streptomyces sp. NPDC017936]|uniref:hypothetical protein n=1 Tax=Streptomyces sp. NPDC017936 TaxID=3365016 RepID=UPI0037A35615